MGREGTRKCPHVSSEGPGERLDGREVRTFLYEMPTLQRSQGAPDRRPAGLDLHHRPANTRQHQTTAPLLRGHRRRRTGQPIPVASVLGKGGWLGFGGELGREEDACKLDLCWITWARS
jgi:hypothetical protein